MPWVVIDKDKKLKPGDVIELEFAVVSGLWLSSAELALIEWRLGERDDFEIISNSLVIDGRIKYKVRIKGEPEPAPEPDQPELQKAGAGITAAVVIGVFLAGTLVMTLAAREVRQWVEIVPKVVSEVASTTAGKVALAGSGALGIAVLVYVVSRFVKW